jgi:hypothetical protein
MATMTPATTGAGSAANAYFIPEVWAADVLSARRNKLVAANLVNTNYEDLLTYGDTVHILSIPEVTADAITPGTAMTPVAVPPTEQLLLVDQYYGKAIEFQDMLTKQSRYELRRPYTERIGFALANAIDSSLLSLFADVDSGNKMTAVATLTFNTLVDATTLLDADNVPMDDRAILVNAVGLGDLRKLDEFTSYLETGRTGVREDKMGIVGEIYGAPVYLTNAVKSNTDSGTPNYQFLLIHKDAFTLAVQKQPEMEYDRDILKKADIIAGSALWGRKAVRPDHAVVIRRNV